MISMQFDRIGAELTAARLRQFNSKVRRQVLLKVGNAAAKPILAVMKATEFPDVSEELRRHLAKKVKGYPGNNVVFLAVGPRSEKVTVDAYEYYRKAHERWYKRHMEEQGRRRSQTRTLNPAHYAHLAGPGRKGTFVKRVQDEMKSATIATIREVLQTEIAKL